jgi:diguanylate cyclase (GGDEF)-like protein
MTGKTKENSGKLLERETTGPMRKLIERIGILQVLIAAGLAGVIVFAGVEMNRSAEQSQADLISNAISQTVNRVSSEQKSAALWDEAAMAVQAKTPDKKWIDTELGRSIYSIYGHEQVYVIDPQDNPVFAYRLGKQTSTAAYEKIRAMIQPIIADVRSKKSTRFMAKESDLAQSRQRYEFLQGSKDGRWAGNLLTMENRTVIVGAITIVPTVDETLVLSKPFILVSVVKVDQSVMNDISDRLIIPDLTLLPLSEKTTHSASMPLVTDEGKSAVQIVWTADRPGRLLLILILPLVMIATLAAGGTTFSLFRRLHKATSDLTARESLALHQALHDALTGLPNRRYFIQHVDEARVYAKEKGVSLAVAYIDIDHFKDVNDTLGHRMGDKLLTAVGVRLKSALREGDVLARFGGDEFAALRILGPSEDGGTFGHDLEQAFQAPIDLFEQSLRVTGSIGIAVIDDFGLTSSDAMRHADIALYQAKDNGRACFVLFTDEMALAIEERRIIEMDLQKVIKRGGQNGGLTMVYQPVIDSASNEIRGVEALVRWSHAQRGTISPAVFIPIAESTGLMPALGEWVLERVFSDAVKWPGLEVAVNLSPAQIRHLNLIPVLKRLLKKYRLDASRIVMEITEGVLLEKTENTANTLREISALGMKLALDDFGTGYSSLSYLRQYKFDKIKIDQSFVRGATENSDSAKIIRTVVDLGKALGMSVVAEGVESEVEAELMTSVGCDELQGFHFSRPVQSTAIDVFFAGPVKAADMAVTRLRA